MVAEMIEKPLTEAQRLVERLESEFALSPAEIAQQTKIKAQTIHDIKRRTNTGNLQLRFLRPLIRALESNGNPLENAGRSDPLFSNPAPSNPEPLAEPLAAGFGLNAEEPAPAPKRGFFDGLRAAMLGDSSQPSQPSMSAPSRRKSEKGDDPKEDFVAKMTPIAALLFVIAVRSRIHDPYKPVAPQPNEMRDIIEPWMTWMAKQLDIRGKLTEDANIVLASLLATGLYGLRAFETYQAIHAEEVQRARSDRSPSGADYLAASGGGPSGGLGGHAAAASSDAGAGRGVPDASVPLPFWRGNAGRARQAVGAAGREPRRESANPEQRRADASIDALLAADHAGRLRLGL